MLMSFTEESKKIAIRKQMNLVSVDELLSECDNGALEAVEEKREDAFQQLMTAVLNKGGK